MVTNFLIQELWIPEALVIFLGSFFLAYGVGVAYRSLNPYLSNVRLISNKVLFYAISTPLQVLLVVLGLYFSLNLIHAHVGLERVFSILPTLKNFALLSIIIWFFLRLLGKAEKELIINREIKPIDVARLDMIVKGLKVVVITAGMLVFLPMMSIDISGLLALGGVGGILVGLMAKDVLANTVGGLMIYVDRPFAKGDWIRLPDRNVEGIVENIAWRLTAIRLFSHQLIYIPNAVFMTTPMENFSRMKRRRLSMQAEIHYQKAAQISSIVETLIPNMEVELLKLESIEPTQPIAINATGFEASTCHVVIKLSVKTIDRAQFQKIQQDILLTIFNTVSEHGYECTSLTQK